MRNHPRSGGLSCLFFAVLFFLLTFLSCISSDAAAANYVYDDLNRLLRVDYDDGSKIEYTYDESGRRTTKMITAVDATPPVTTAAPPGGVYITGQSVTLTCTDGPGSGCDKIYRIYVN